MHQNRFTVDSLSLISSAIDLVLMLLFVADYVSDFLLLALQLYSSFPCPCGGYIGSRVSGLYIFFCHENIYILTMDVLR